MTRYFIKGILISLIGLNSLISNSQQVDSDSVSGLMPLRMDDVWQRALIYSKKIQLSAYETDISEVEIREAQFERLPEWNFKGNIEHASNMAMYEHGLLEKPTQHEIIHLLYRVGTDAYLNVYNGNKVNLTIDKAKILHEIANEQKNLTTSEIKLQASTYYLSLQRSLIYKELMIKDIANQEKQLSEIQELLKNGVVLKSDELRVQLKLSNQKMLLVTIDNDIAIATQKLNIIIGYPDTLRTNPIEFLNPGMLQLKTYEQYLEEAMENAYQYRISERSVALKKVQLKYVRSNVQPKVGLYGDYYLANPQIFLFPYSPSNYTLGIFGLRASMPLSEIYMNRPKSKIAAMNYEKEELEHHHTEDQIRKKVYENFLRFKEALIRIDVTKVNVDQATENARIVDNNYFNQTSLITDLLDANIQLIQSQFDYESAKIQAQLTYYQLQHIIGIL
jgi:outer membrane protein